MQLSDKDIKIALKKQRIFIDSFSTDRLQPASYDVLLGNNFLVFDNTSTTFIDPRSPITPKMSKIHCEDEKCFVLQPKQFALGVTKDKIGVDSLHSCQIDGKSSLARYGLIVHTTAGYIDPGNNLCITLELFNTNSIPILLYPNMKIAQIRFYRLSSPSERPYGTEGLNSKYFNSTDVQASKMHLNWLQE